MVEIALGLVAAFLAAIPAILNILEGRTARRVKTARDLAAIESKETEDAMARIATRRAAQRVSPQTPDR